jgi:riboflavin kinase / FMN adenylyltransferase
MALSGGLFGGRPVIVATWEEFLAGRTASGPSLRERRAFLTIGAFDGLHLGHRRLIAGITGTCGPEDGKPLAVVVTFRRPPGHVLGRPEVSGLILSLPQKLRRLAALGVGAVVLIDFSREISTLPGRDFIGLLRGRLTIERIVVGPNFRFGMNRDADVRDLEAMFEGSSTTVQAIEPVRFGGEVVSSSRIRRLVREGGLAAAAAMLAAPYEVDLAGLTAAREGPAVLRLSRAEVPQVLPAAGTWAVTGRSPQGDVSGTLEAAEDSVVIRLARDVQIAAVAFATDTGNERSQGDGTDH